jgi:hypothetical protein
MLVILSTAGENPCNSITARELSHKRLELHLVMCPKKKEFGFEKFILEVFVFEDVVIQVGGLLDVN